MQPKLLATISTEAEDLEAAARQFAIAVATAIDADEGGDILVGPICSTAQRRVLQIMFARPAGALIAMNINPGPLAIRNAAAREKFRDAVIAGLERYGRARAFSSVRQLIAAARAPAAQREALLH